MNRYLSLILLYNRACRTGIFVAALSIPIGLSAIFLTKQSFSGTAAVLLFLAAILIGLMAVANSFTGRKNVKATNAITGYTFRRLRISPTSAYLTVFVYCVAVVILLWGIAIGSLNITGKAGLACAVIDRTGVIYYGRLEGNIIDLNYTMSEDELISVK